MVRVTKGGGGGAGALTVSTVETAIPSSVAEIVELPVATPDASPAAVIVDTEGVDDAQVTWLVRISVE